MCVGFNANRYKNTNYLKSNRYDTIANERLNFEVLINNVFTLSLHIAIPYKKAVLTL